MPLEKSLSVITRQHDYVFASMANYNLLKTPLFAALPTKMFEELAQSCEEIQKKPEFTKAKNFEHSYLNDISFSPPKLVRSIYRSMKFKISGKL